MLTTGGRAPVTGRTVRQALREPSEPPVSGAESCFQSFSRARCAELPGRPARGRLRERCVERTLACSRAVLMNISSGVRTDGSPPATRQREPEPHRATGRLVGLLPRRQAQVKDNRRTAAEYEILRRGSSCSHTRTSCATPGCLSAAYAAMSPQSTAISRQAHSSSWESR